MSRFGTWMMCAGIGFLASIAGGGMSENAAAAPVKSVMSGSLMHDLIASKVAAANSAKTWLQLLDRMKYVDSWKASAQSFRVALNSRQWAQKMATVRRQYGTSVSRTFAAAKFTEILPSNSAQGEFIIAEFRTAYTRKGICTETVTMTLEPDGKWRASGFFIRPGSILSY